MIFKKRFGFKTTTNNSSITAITPALCFSFSPPLILHKSLVKYWAEMLGRQWRAQRELLEQNAMEMVAHELCLQWRKHCCIHSPLQCPMVASTIRRWGLFLQLLDSRLAGLLIDFDQYVWWKVMWWKGRVEETEVPQTTGTTDPGTLQPLWVTQSLQLNEWAPVRPAEELSKLPVHRIIGNSKSLLFIYIYFF